MTRGPAWEYTPASQMDPHRRDHDADTHGLCEPSRLRMGCASQAACSHQFPRPWGSSMRNNVGMGAPDNRPGSAVGYHVFLSCAGEDTAVADELAASLSRSGLQVWYAPFVLKVGDSILASINAGLSGASSGVLLISPDFLRKDWPSYETTVLVHDYIEKRKKVFPVWHNVTAEAVRERWPGLADVYAVSTATGMDSVVRTLVRAFIPGAGTVAVPPPYEDPVRRFFRGQGELTVGDDGPAFNLWEAVALFKLSDYPVWLQGRLYSHDEFLAGSYLALTGDAEASLGMANGAYVPAVLAILVDQVPGVGPSDFGLTQSRFRSLVATGRKMLQHKRRPR
jgi:TIR domain